MVQQLVANATAPDVGTGKSGDKTAGPAAVTVVQLEALALLKLVKHCRESLAASPGIASPVSDGASGRGQLVGLDLNGRLEITNCFPLTQNDGQGVAMLRAFRAVNFDYNTVGWYQAVGPHTPSIFTRQLIETQYNYQQSIPNSVILVYDAVRSSQGTLSLRAYRLSDTCMKLYEQQVSRHEVHLVPHSDTPEDMFLEIPIVLHQSSLAQAFMASLEEGTRTDPLQQVLSPTYQAMDLAYEGPVECALENMVHGVEERMEKQNSYQMYARRLARRKKDIDAFILQRKAEDKERVKAGKEPLPEADLTTKFPLPALSPLDAHLLDAKLHTQMGLLRDVSLNSLAKLSLLQELGKSLVSPTRDVE